jgi:hypothetical protein
LNSRSNRLNRLSKVEQGSEEERNVNTKKITSTLFEEKTHGKILPISRFQAKCESLAA